MRKIFTVLSVFLIALSSALPAAGEEPVPVPPDTMESAQAEETPASEEPAETVPAEEETKNQPPAELPEETSDAAVEEIPYETAEAEETTHPSETEEAVSIASAEPVEQASSKEEEKEAARGEEMILSEGQIDLGKTWQELQDSVASSSAPSGRGPKKVPMDPHQGETGEIEYFGTTAQFDMQIEGESGMERLNMYYINGHPVYCIQPEVNIKNSSYNPAVYSGDVWQELTEEQRQLCKRIAFFGYDHPMSGSSSVVYTATQLLIWEAIGYPKYQEILDSLIPTNFDKSSPPNARPERKQQLLHEMENLRSLVQNYDRVPSFAGTWHTVNSFDLEYQKELQLEDRRHVLSWFQSTPQEEYEGIETAVEGDTLKLKINSLCFEEDRDETILTFLRNPDQWIEMQNGIIMYTSGENQHLIGESGMDPVHDYKIRISMKRADLHVKKEDEYGSTEYSGGTQFILSLSPEVSEGVLKNPVQDKDGNLKIFTCDADGILRIENLLPAGADVYIQEYAAGMPLVSIKDVYSVKMPDEGTMDMTFTDPLTDADLNILKVDEEDPSARIDGAVFTVYETDDLTVMKKAAAYGLHAPAEEENLVTYEQAMAYSSLAPGDVFSLNGRSYEILSSEDDRVTLKVSDEGKKSRRLLTRYSLPADAAPGSIVHISKITNKHGTAAEEDDEKEEHVLTILKVICSEESTFVQMKEVKGEPFKTDPSSAISMNRLKNALKAQRKKKEAGEILPIGAETYEILSCSESEAVLQPVSIETVSLSDPSVEYEDLPDPCGLKEGEQFNLSYPFTEDGENFSEGNQTFTCVEKSLGKIILESEGSQYEVECPDWMSSEDLPEKISRRETFRILMVEDPAYLVEDSRGNTFYVASDRTEVLKKASSVHPELNTTEMDGTTYHIRYEEISSACSAGIYSKGCPVGTSLVKPITYTHILEYDGPEYADLTEEQKVLKSGSTIEFNGRTYLVRDNFITYMVLEYEEDGYQCRALIYTGGYDAYAYCKPVMDVEFKVTGYARPRKVQIMQESGPAAGDVFVLAPDIHHTLSWDDIMDHDIPAGRIITAPDTARWQVRKNEKEVCMVMETDGVRLAVYPDHTENVSPLLWQEYADAEAEAGRYLKKDDILQIEKEHLLQEGDVFERDSFSFQVLSLEENGQAVLACRKQKAGESEVLVVKPRTVPEVLPQEIITVYRPAGITMQEVLSNAAGHQENEQFTINSVSYRIEKIEEQEDGMHVLVKETLTGREHEILELTGTDPFSYQQYLEAPKDLTVGTELWIRGKKYTVSSADAARVLLSGEDGREVEVTKEDGRHDLQYLTFLKPYQVYDLDALFHEEGNYELIGRSPHITLEDNTVYADGAAFASIAVKDEEGSVLERKNFFFGTDPHEGTMQILPVAHGSSGHQYIRIYDPADHNYPVSGKETAVYQDSGLQKEVCRKTSDAWGMVDVTELPAGTYYFEENGNVQSFEVKKEKGLFSVKHLKAGRQYMVCEESLPEGYDYGHQQACTFIALKDDDAENEVTFTNRLRRLRLVVRKTDQDQSSIPLNGAWFSVTDLTYADHENQKEQELSISDIPEDARAGTTFQVWNALKGGQKHIWRIEECNEEKAVLSRLDNGAFQGSYTVPVNGSSKDAPMLYRDIVRSTHKPRKGIVFQTTEKEPYENLKKYRVLSITSRNAPDLFGSQTSRKEICDAVVIEEEKPEELIHVYEENSIPVNGASIGEFISGGIIVSETEKVQSIPLSWEDALLQAGGEESMQEGMKVSGSVRHTASVPSYGEIERTAKTGKNTLQFQGTEWKVLSSDGSSFQIEGEGQLLEVDKGMPASGISWTDQQPLEITMIWRDAEGKCTGISVQSSDGMSWFIGRDQKPQAIQTGKPGIKVQIFSEKTGKIVYSGITGTDGRLVYTDVPDGDYIIVKDGKKEKVHCEKGMITLPEIRYGHTIKVCETKSPLGYVIGDACTVITPRAAYGTDTVHNYRTNAKVKKIITVTRKKVKERETGITE